MKIKVALASVALLAACVATPASAQTSIHFVNNGNPLGGGGTIVHFLGNISWDSGESGGIDCSELTVQITFHTFEGEVVTLDCLEGETFGALKEVFGCEMEEEKKTPLPWTVEPVTTSKMRLLGIELIIPMKPGCLVGEDVIFEEGGGEFVDLETVEAGRIGAVTISGGLESDIGPVDVEGGLTPTVGEPMITLGKT
jgi:hypothetical protein